MIFRLEAAILFLLVACGDDGGGTSDGGSASVGTSSTTSGSGGGDTAPCPQGSLLAKVPGAVVDPGGSCLRTDASELVMIEVCVAEIGDTPDFYCFDHLEDGRRVWVGHRNQLVAFPSVWAPCPTPPEEELVFEKSPPPCFAAQCSPHEGLRSAPASICSDDATRTLHECGAAGSEWDADCCYRTPCNADRGDADCPSGECRDLVATGRTSLWYEHDELTNPGGFDPLESCRSWPSLRETPVGFCFEGQD